MAQTQVSERLIKRIRWLGGSDPTWTEEDGRPTTTWAVTQALALLEGVTAAGQPYETDPQITATAQGGIEFLWKGSDGREVDVVLPPDAGLPIEITWAEEHDGTIAEDEHEVPAVEDAVALITRAAP
jgi:hypothetical protein